MTPIGLRSRAAGQPRADIEFAEQRLTADEPHTRHGRRGELAEPDRRPLPRFHRDSEPQTRQEPAADRGQRGRWTPLRR
jgi:hypothetical protein